MKKKNIKFLLLMTILSGCNFVKFPSTNINSSTNKQSELSTTTSNNEETLDKARINEVYNNIANYMKDVSNKGETSNIRKKGKYEIYDDYSTLQSIVALMKFTANMYMNEEFVFTDNLLVFNVLGAKMAFCNEVKYLENKVVTNIVFPYGEKGSELLINIEVNYNFSIDFINNFTIRQIGWEGNECNLHFKYENNEFYIFTPTNDLETETSEGKEITQETIAIRDNIKANEENKIEIEADFSEEYTDAMEFAF